MLLRLIKYKPRPSIDETLLSSGSDDETDYFASAVRHKPSLALSPVKLHWQLRVWLPFANPPVIPNVSSRYSAASLSRTICKIWRKHAHQSGWCSAPANTDTTPPDALGLVEIAGLFFY